MTNHLTTIKSAILMHALKYSKMRPCDAVKLVYQACFGPGHLINDEEKALAFLKSEYLATRQRETAPLLEPIGGGMVRINLAALDPNNVSVESVFEAFLASSKIKTSEMPDFLAALDLLRELASESVFRFSLDDLNTYLDEYAALGYPMVSHSEEYKEAYEPAYRVVCEELFRR